MMLTRAVDWLAIQCGRTAAVPIAIAPLLVWMAAGPLYHWSDTFQMVGNTFMSAVSYVLLFVLQRTQVRDTAALHLKVDALVAANRAVSNKLVAIETRPVEEIAAEAERLRAKAHP